MLPVINHRTKAFLEWMVDLNTQMQAKFVENLTAGRLNLQPNQRKSIVASDTRHVRTTGQDQPS